MRWVRSPLRRDGGYPLGLRPALLAAAVPDAEWGRGVWRGAHDIAPDDSALTMQEVCGTSLVTQDWGTLTEADDGEDVEDGAGRPNTGSEFRMDLVV